ncbi:hypothetical protein BKP37_10120 [Anaerobacillus alkalilacustris]|uniref:DUF624 domain-containing protein n=1 Tax=Anaerobacillus alkalilacustris TaxID=393763 RepID=A0A1S2LMN7_9BACI|nr:DUF624 domain-containing protein [Anaerobacillus alkalilacustris]OIJ13626.1 hypothetical protein BKP37_10120 [Anaerobacillus alkalilacustris]
MEKMMSGFYNVSEWIARFAVANVLWLIFTFPFGIVVVNVVLVDSYSFSLPIIVYLSLCFPLLVFPATTALFAVSRDWVIGQDQDNIIKNYWKYYKENYKTSVKIGVVLTIAWIVTIGDIYYFQNTIPVIMYFFIGLGLLLFVVSIHAFSVMAHFNIRVLDVMKKALLFSVVKPQISLFLIIVTAMILFVSINYLRFLLLFFSFSFISFIATSLFLKMYSLFSIKKS